MHPEQDIKTFGFLASLWRYALAARRKPAVVTPFAARISASGSSLLPHLVAVQSESFFDVRVLYQGIDRSILTEYDHLKRDAMLSGKLRVPAWGANTVRTEFAFLSGIGADALGVHRFNPYRAVAAGWHVATLATFLQRLGYYTVCVHPYPASFYLRDRVYPRFGFDAFLDIRAFVGVEKSKPYVGDMAVADKIASILDQASAPVFVFAITMENHGPLHLETPTAKEVQRFYTVPPPPSCDDLTIYLRHLANADRMVAALRQHLEQCDRPAGLCWYGDHVPIMPAVYEVFGVPTGDVEFVLWSNDRETQNDQRDLDAHQLSRMWLQTMNIT
jgi:phosphoglycerol transferase MdoB-like AlkP superfamily enzyme